GEDAADVDAERADHLVVVDARADDRPDPRAGEQKPEQDADQERDAEDEDPAPRIRDRAELPGLRERARHRNRDRLASPDDEREVGGDEGDAHRQQELRGLLAGEAPKQAPLEQEAGAGHRSGGPEDRDPEAPRRLQSRIPDVAADEEGA